MYINKLNLRVNTNNNEFAQEKKTKKERNNISIRSINK